MENDEFNETTLTLVCSAVLHDQIKTLQYLVNNWFRSLQVCYVYKSVVIRQSFTQVERDNSAINLK